MDLPFSSGAAFEIGDEQWEKIRKHCPLDEHDRWRIEQIVVTFYYHWAREETPSKLVKLTMERLRSRAKALQFQLKDFNSDIGLAMALAKGAEFDPRSWEEFYKSAEVEFIARLQTDLVRLLEMIDRCQKVPKADRSGPKTGAIVQFVWSLNEIFEEATRHDAKGDVGPRSNRQIGGVRYDGISFITEVCRLVRRHKGRTIGHGSIQTALKVIDDLAEIIRTGQFEPVDQVLAPQDTDSKPAD